MDNRSETLSSPNRVGDLMREIKVCLLGVGMKVLKNRIGVVLMVVMFLLFLGYRCREIMFSSSICLRSF